jgi:peroxiredoxin
MVLVESIKLPLGTPVQDFALKGIDGNTHSLALHKSAKVLVLVFMCNHCPYAQAVWPRLNALALEFAPLGVQFLGINPNINNPDYGEETFEKMKEYARKFKMTFPYLADDSQEVAKAYRAQCTPDIYVFDKERKLVYHGRVDDNWKEPDKVTRHELKDALKQILAGTAPEVQNPSIGCSIKWK